MSEKTELSPTDELAKFVLTVFKGVAWIIILGFAIWLIGCIILINLA